MGGLLRANIRAHGRRYTATGIAISICLVFVMICLSFSASIHDSLTRDVTNEYAGVATVISLRDSDGASSASQAHAGDATSSEHVSKLNEIKTRVEKIDGVRAVGYEALKYVELRAGDKQIDRPVYPLNPSGIGIHRISEGHAPSGPHEVLLDSESMKNLGVKVGGKIEVSGQSSGDKNIWQSMTVTGSTERELLGFSKIFLAPSDMGELLGGDIAPYALLVASDSETPSKNDADLLTQKISEQLSPSDNLSVTTGYQALNNKLTDMDMNSGSEQTTAILLVFPAIALVVAAMVISSTFSVIFRQRRREIALLRTLGATAKQVRSMVLREAFLIGMISSAIGVLVGVILSVVILGSFKAYPTYADAFKAQSPFTIALVWVVGILLTVIVGIRPSLGIAKVSPLAALSPVDPDSAAVKKTHRIRLGIGISMVILGIIGIAVGLKTSSVSMSFLLSFLSGLVCWVGAVLVFSVLLPYIASACGTLLRGNVTRLARANTTRNPERTASVGTGIIVGVTLISMMVVGASSLSATLKAHVDTKRPFDLSVASPTTVLNPDVLPDIARIKGVEAVAPYHSIKDYLIENNGNYATSPGVLVGEPDLNTVSHSPVTLLADNQIRIFGTDAGKPVKICTPDKAKCADFVTVAPPKEYAPTTISEAQLLKLFPEAHLSQAYVKLSTPDIVDSVQSDIHKLPGLLKSYGPAEERAQYMNAIQTVLITVVILLSVSVIVALVGVANSLSLSVLERNRENALLRALGLTKRQMKQMLKIEALLTAIASIIAGLVMGVAFGIVGTYAIPIDDIKEYIVVIPWLQIICVAAVVLIAVLIASWLPGRRAARLSPVEALTSE